MKLADLDPGWLTTTDGRHGMGIAFVCPHCMKQRLGVWFINPTDDGPPAPTEYQPAPRWHRSGDSFADISLSPSIDASATGHWHGFISNGETK